MGLGLYMKAFFDLAADRQSGGRIPWSTVMNWCDRKGLDPDDADDAWLIISRMDLAYMDWARTKSKAGRPPEGDPRKEGRNGIPAGVRR